MAFKVGEVKTVQISGSTGTYTLNVKKDEDSARKVGGLSTVDDEANFTNTGEMINEVAWDGWMVTVNIMSDDLVRFEQEKLQKTSGSGDLHDITFSCLNGAIYSGAGLPVGMFERSGKGLISVTFRGEGELKPIN